MSNQKDDKKKSASDDNSEKKTVEESEDRKRKKLEETLEELQNERERLREKNRTNSQRFRDRKKGYMDGLFEEKYKLGKVNNELKKEQKRLQLALQEALEENNLLRMNALQHQIPTMPSASTAAVSMPHQPSLLQKDQGMMMGIGHFGYGGTNSTGMMNMDLLSVPPGGAGMMMGGGGTPGMYGMTQADPSAFFGVGGGFGGLGTPMMDLTPQFPAEINEIGMPNNDTAQQGIEMPENIAS